MASLNVVVDRRARKLVVARLVAFDIHQQTEQTQEQPPITEKPHPDSKERKRAAMRVSGAKAR